MKSTPILQLAFITGVYFKLDFMEYASMEYIFQLAFITGVCFHLYIFQLAFITGVCFHLYIFQLAFITGVCFHEAFSQSLVQLLNYFRAPLQFGTLLHIKILQRAQMFNIGQRM